MVAYASYETFDHGILINKGSTDRSVEICKIRTALGGARFCKSRV